MKVTDYCPRAAPFDSYLKGRDLVGVEIGVDVGAHAEALLRHCPIAHLTLIDPWPNPWCRGVAEGRLWSLGFRTRYSTVIKTSAAAAAAKIFSDASLDFVYIDQEHDAATVSADLTAWWPAVKRGGVLGHRNYTALPTPMSQAIDAFVKLQGRACEAHLETGEMVLVKP